MKEIVIVGPGGLGGTFAALLGHKGQCSVTVVGRPGAHMDAIRQEGLKLTGRRECVTRVNAVDDPAQIKACDAIIYVVKAQDTATVLARTAHIAVRDFVASLQNSTIKDDLLSETFGADKVIVGVSAGGQRVAITDDSAISLDMDEKWQYVRFECWGDGEQFAWTQPFWAK